MNRPMEPYRMQVSEMQRKLAQKATTDKTHPFELTGPHSQLIFQRLVQADRPLSLFA